MFFSEWSRVGINKQSDYAILTNEITKAWSGKTIQEYKQFKDLKKENLRDNMTNLELVLNMLAEVSTKELSEQDDPTTMDESKILAQKGGGVAKLAKDELESQLKKKVVTSKNAKEIHFNKKNQLN